MRAYDVAGAYLLEDSVVYPISAWSPNSFNGAPAAAFVEAVKAAIRENVDR